MKFKETLIVFVPKAGLPVFLLVCFTPAFTHRELHMEESTSQGLLGHPA